MPRLVETSGEEDVKSLHDSRRTAGQAEGYRNKQTRSNTLGKVF